jgi:hypothetical protein
LNIDRILHDLQKSVGGDDRYDSDILGSEPLVSDLNAAQQTVVA